MSIGQRASDRRVELTIKLNASDDACWVSGSRQLIAGAVVNLLSNAVKLSSSGCAVHRTCEHRERVVMVSVNDDGRVSKPNARCLQWFSRGAHHGSNDTGDAGFGPGAFPRALPPQWRGR